MPQPELLEGLGAGAGAVLAFVLSWAALFVLGPPACAFLLVLQLAGTRLPPGSQWLYPATAAAWLLALGVHAAFAAAGRAIDRLGSRLHAAWRPLRRKPRVVIVDAATGAPSWDWGAARDAEFTEWARSAARIKQAVREKLRETEAARSGEPAPPPRAPSAAPPRSPRGPHASGARPGPQAPPRAAPPPRPQPPPPSPPSPPSVAAHDVLGVARTATQDQIRHAYRELIKQYHPDRVAGMPKEFRDVAHERTREIRDAYETLKRRG